MSSVETAFVSVLLVEDDEDDRDLTREALQNSRLANEMRFVVDGQDLMDYLRREGRYADPAVQAPRPGIILLDLNMPKKDGREALAEIKQDESLRSIPVVVLTTSDKKRDVAEAYGRQANCFITKPFAFAEYIDTVRELDSFWLSVATLPQ